MRIVPGQQGYALLVFVIMLMAATATMGVKIFNRSNSQIARDNITAAALAQAKEALIGFAIIYSDTHASQSPGYLPLPDLGSSRNLTLQEGNAAANFSGNSKNLTVIGRLPWRTLGLSPLRDGQGECLWYAISGSFQNTQKANMLNWDSLGHFDAYSSNGTSSGTASLTGGNYAQRQVAIIFSASDLLQGQNRKTSTNDNVSTCGGNYDARNYLDSFNIDANINNIVNYFAGATNNSTGYAYNLIATSDGSQLTDTDLAFPKKVVFGDIKIPDSKIANDRIVTISVDDIFRPIIRRPDFSAQIAALLNDAAFIAHLQSVSIAGTKGTGNVNCVNTSNSDNNNFCTNWKEMLLLTQLPVAAPIIINSVATVNCSRVLIFGGQKTGAQVRLAITDKSNPANYLETPNLAAFAVPIAASSNFSGITTFNASNPSADLMRCLT